MSEPISRVKGAGAEAQELSTESRMCTLNPTVGEEAALEDRFWHDVDEFGPIVGNKTC